MVILTKTCSLCLIQNVIFEINLVITIAISACAISVPINEQNFREKENIRSADLTRFIFSASALLGSQLGEKDFKIIWNVPTFQCHKYGFHFSQLAKWGISQNYEDSFRGDKIALLYDPGLFPALLEANSDSELIRRNGGVPQHGDLNEHLKIFTQQLTNKLIPNEHFSGNAVIDFEHWRPIWSENFGSLTAYRRVSRDVEEALHPLWNSSEIENEAARRFEEGALQFFKSTLQTARTLRPRAAWGYYGYPLCFNFTPKNHQAHCTETAMQDNKRLKWLFDESGAIYPSLYYRQYGMNKRTRALFMKGRITEAIRVSSLSSFTPPVYCYTWFKYYDSKHFVTQTDLMNSFLIPKKEGAAGIILWGASNDVNDRQKCEALNEYVEEILGPSVQYALKILEDNITIDYDDYISAEQLIGAFSNDADYL